MQTSPPRVVAPRTPPGPDRLPRRGADRGDVRHRVAGADPAGGVRRRHEAQRHDLLPVDPGDQLDQPREDAARDVGAHVLPRRAGQARERSQHPGRIGLLGERHHHAALAPDAVVVGAVAAGADVGEGLEGRELLAAGLEVDADPVLAVLRGRDPVEHGAGHVDRDPAEGVNHLHEAAEVDQRVVVHAQPGEVGGDLLQRRRARVAAGEAVRVVLRPAVEGVQDVGEGPARHQAGRGRRQRDRAHVARQGQQRRAARAGVDGGDDHRVGAEAVAAGPRVAAEQEHGEPAARRPGRGRLGAGLRLLRLQPVAAACRRSPPP